MKDTITITSKGQTTLPVAIRRKLGLDSDGGVLRIDFDEASEKLTISRPVTFATLRAKTSKYIKPNTEPLEDVDEYYQKHRSV